MNYSDMYVAFGEKWVKGHRTINEDVLEADIEHHAIEWPEDLFNIMRKEHGWWGDIYRQRGYEFIKEGLKRTIYLERNWPSHDRDFYI